MKAAVTNMFHLNRRRSTPASMYDCLEQCYEWSNSNYRQSMQAHHSDGFWKVFMMESRGKQQQCCGTQPRDSTDSYEHLSSATCQCMNHTKTSRRRKFRSQSGYYLAVLPNGQIMGVKDATSPYSKFIQNYFTILIRYY